MPPPRETPSSSEMDDLIFEYSSLSFLPGLKDEQKDEASFAEVRDIDPSTLNYIVDHLFLPPHLPQSDVDNTPTNDLHVLYLVRDVVSQFHSNQVSAKPSQQMQHVVKMLKVMTTLHGEGHPGQKALMQAFQGMQEGDIIPIYIVIHNAALIIEHCGSTVTVSSFEISPRNTDVLASPCRLRCSYPDTMVSISTATFHSPYFLEQLTTLLSAMSVELPTDRPIPKSAQADAKDTEVIDSNAPIYITEFLTGLLRGIGKGVALGSEGGRRICKRIADEVLLRNARLPWRRSPIWLVIRVALQTSLVNTTPSISEVERHRDYKLLMLYILTRVLHGAIQVSDMPNEKLSHMCRKLSRRAAKLEVDGWAIPSPLLDIVSETIKSAGGVLAHRFAEVQAQVVRKLEWPPAEGLNATRDTEVTMVKSREYLRNVLKEHHAGSSVSHPAVFNASHPRRIYHDSQVSPIYITKLLGSSDSADRSIVLKDIESWVEKSLDNFITANIDQQSACRELYILLIAYRKVAESEYNSSPVDRSLMLLTILEMWIAIDQITTSTIPLLHNYPCEIDVTFLSLLLLPTEAQLKRLHKIEAYIRTRQSHCTGPSTFEDGAKITPQSFHVRYFDQSDLHQNLRDTIIKQAESDKDKKIAEFEDLKRKYNCLKERAKDMHCECVYETESKLVKTCTRCELKSNANNCMDRVGGMSCECIRNAEGLLMDRCTRCQLTMKADDLMTEADSRSCECVYSTRSKPISLCSRCEATSNASSLEIMVHEWPLPRTELEIKAVVIELSLPAAFAAWRDATYDVLVNVLAPDSKKLYDNSSTYPLSGYKALAKYFKNEAQQLSWLSSANIACQTRKISNVLFEADYLVPSRMKYRLATKEVGGTVWITDQLTRAANQRMRSVQKMCTFQLPKSSNELQYALDSTDHTSNYSIGHQWKCPAGWSLHEYYAFTTLRAGFRLQWLNILREVRAGNLRLNRFETGLLFTQTIWQAGPLGTSETGARETHENLHDANFCHLLLNALEDCLTVLKENWLQHLSMQILISIGARILSLARSEQIKSQAAQFLRTSRHVCIGWMRDLLTRFYDSENDERAQKWQRLALAMAATCRLTFNVDLRDLNAVFNTQEDIADFIECAVCIGLTAPPNIREHEFSLLLARDARLAHGMEAHLRELVSRNSQCVHAAILRIWPEYVPGRQWEVLKAPNDRWIMTTTSDGEPRCVHYNLLEGTLLVDGLCAVKLPKDYMNSMLYRRLFENRTFQVVRTRMLGMEFETVHPVCAGDAELKVYFAMRNKQLIIRTKKGCTVHEIIPHGELTDDFPVTMLNSYAHFLNLNEQTLEFRPIKEGKSLWTPSRENWVVTISRWTDSWLAQGRRTISGDETTLIDFRSPTHKAIGAIFQSIEKEARIEVTVSMNNKLGVNLPRYQLAFDIDGSQSSEAQIACRNFPGTVIDVRPKVGQDMRTLYGLETYLVLREAGPQLCNTARTVIIPHGNVRYKRMEHHTSVRIDTETDDNAQTVTYHLYTVDAVLGRLVPNGSMKSRLYKAYLHALTSYCLPDPLTGLTGTEQALDDLRSASSWSFQTLDTDEITLLIQIFELTPVRMYSPERPGSKEIIAAQTIEWQEDLPSFCQHGEFYSIIKSIRHHWKRTAVFQQVHCPFLDGRRFVDRSNDNLQKRASIREGAYQPIQYGGSLHSRHLDRSYQSRSLSGQDLESRVCRISRLAYEWTANVQPTQRLREIIEGWDKLATKTIFRFGYQHYWHCDSPVEYWYPLYNFCRNCSPERDKFRILFVLSSLAYRGEAEMPMELIETVLAFATNPVFATIPPPGISETKNMYYFSYGTEATMQQIRRIITGHVVQFYESPQGRHLRLENETQDAWRDRCKGEYDRELSSQIERAVHHYHSQWPCATASPISPPCYPLLELESALPDLNRWFLMWFHNRAFMQHIAAVQTELDQIRTRSSLLKGVEQYNLTAIYPALLELKPVKSIHDLLDAKDPWVESHSSATELRVHASNLPRGTSTTRDPLRELFMQCSNINGFHRRYSEDLVRSWEALRIQEQFQARKKQITIRSLKDVESHVKLCVKVVRDMFSEIVAVLSPKDGTIEELLYRTGLQPRVTVRSLLEQLRMHNHRNTERAEGWKEVLVSFGESITLYQKALRLHHHTRQNDWGEFSKEWENKGRDGWNPLEYPEWLLFEIENDILIRPVQAQIAAEMLSPHSGENTVMQLNMGEGKSSVIVPIIAAALADRKKLVRVVVLKPLWSQMFQLLVQKLSGLLNRRIYYLPISRQIKSVLNDHTVPLIMDLYKECMNNGGILLTQPEHILSFKLIGIEMADQDGTRMTRELLTTQHWLEQHSRDILDESDELLNIRYQLIYTIGLPRPPQLSPERWIIIQEIFSLVRKHMCNLKERYPDGMELIEQHDAPGSFPFSRLLKQETEVELIKRIAADITTGSLKTVPMNYFTNQERELVLRYISEKNVGEEELLQLKESSPFFLLLKGFIAHGILAFVLREKRWRVDYGLRDAPHKSNLAVPYRGKDSPVPRAEFSHIDVTIALTCLCYYYQGLSQPQLLLCFDRLHKLTDPDAEYLSWIAQCKESLPVTLRQLNGINLEDNDQWSRTVYPLLKLNKSVIDFYLSAQVFPRGCREFPRKLISSSWDLAEKKMHPTTGFSGTNDNRYLFPLSIEQLDLEEQAHTNAKVLRYLLQPENNFYTCIRTAEGERLQGSILLRRLLEVERPIQVLLDVGAQVLDMKNEEVAILWLDLAEKQGWTAALFFSDDDELMVVGKDRSVYPYIASPYVKNIGKCLVYLDEAHTRGTDIKLPPNSIAAVTLGPKLTKDKLVQACMRMRKLGQPHGQTVRFFAPREVHNKILEHSNGTDTGKPIGTIDILSWVIHETCKQAQRNVALWANQGISYQTRQNAWRKCVDGGLITHGLSTAWQEQESKTLEQMYSGSNRQWDSVTKIDRALANTGLQARYEQLKVIKSRCEEYQAQSLQEGSFQEEQEREVAREVEQEEDVEPPPRATIHKHSLDPTLLHFIKTGEAPLPPGERGSPFILLIDTLKQTSFSQLIERWPWAQNILATFDFTHTIRLEGEPSAGGPLALCLLSPFEVNELLPVIRHSKFVNLHIYSPKVERVASSLQDLTYAVIPPLPEEWKNTFSQSEKLMIQVNLYAGQLFFGNYETYQSTCGFLGIFLRGESNILPEGVRPDGFLRNWRKDGEQGEQDVAFQKSPLNFLRCLVTVRRKGLRFTKSHVGFLVRGKELRKQEWD
ncbi:hypothetical protein BDZ91DRAFT_795394 [Kalaharituber pfeilii]|nr:hypothetical protein BDZ91DRAFT_795394 [Kalaharituber pfeilii]